MSTCKGQRRLVVISDYQDGPPAGSAPRSVDEYRHKWVTSEREDLATGDPRKVLVEGSYMERLPLACLKAGLVEKIEVWTHWRGDRPPLPDMSGAPYIIRRSFQMNGPQAPFASNEMLAYILTFGPPYILCVWGLGVSEEILDACSKSYKIYNSIDAPALRIPVETSRYFDLVLTGAQWQSDEVVQRHPDMATAVLPIGPEFASQTMFYPLNIRKPYDVVYVAAAQGYKRHDVLFSALSRLPRSIRALCVFGYGELSEALRTRARELQLDVDFVGPPGVPFTEVNRLMNQAKVGVVCGVEDGAPAILTEYMLAGLPVVANAALCCGLQYITPQTGRMATAARFDEAITEVLGRLDEFSPRQAVLDNWTWPHSVRKLREVMGLFKY